MAEGDDITRLLEAVNQGDHQARDALFNQVYPALKTIAKAHRRRWRGDDTMNTTALIHEAYLKLTVNDDPDWQGRSHFFATAARAMRQILVNYAERQQAEKRGGGQHPVTLDEDQQGNDGTIVEVLALNAALTVLEAEYPRRCQVAECRVFGGMTNDEIAHALDISLATVKRDWALAAPVLREHMSAPE
ncbi:MAG: ECF-type sigma factor [Lysobacterales bacterium]